MPLLMELACPVEFCRTEVTRDSAGHAQAYLTFMNLSDRCVEGISAMVTLEDACGKSLGIRPLRYRGISAPGRCRFTLCMAGDALPFFANARVLIEQVRFEDGTLFRMDEDALMDCTVEEEPPGERRSALISVVGEDARCFASARTGAWVCVCGRFNENSANACVRCGRSRREVFAFTPERVLERYALWQRRHSDALESERIDARARAQKVRTQRQADYRKRVARERRRAWGRVGLACALLAVLAIGLCLQGIRT